MTRNTSRVRSALVTTAVAVALVLAMSVPTTAAAAPETGKVAFERLYTSPIQLLINKATQLMLAATTSKQPEPTTPVNFGTTRDPDGHQ